MRVALMGSLLICGCVEVGSGQGWAPPVPDEAQEIDEGAAPYIGPVEGMETQGRFLLGESIDSLDGGAGLHFSVTTDGMVGTTARAVEFFGHAGLRFAGTNQPAHDVTLAGAAGGELHAQLARQQGSTMLYRLQHRATADDSWAPLCDGAEAVPLAGTFTTTGLHQDTPDRISFACADGVAAKCTSWGYRAGGVRAQDPWQIHQACTRMARGDYCADGTPHTYEGTLISIFDEVGVNPAPPSVFFGVTSWPPPPREFYFEAGWKGEGEPPVCLSKLRWQTLPLGGFCSDRLPDPREDVNVRFCDDYGSAESIAAAGAWVFNASRYGALLLSRWKRVGGDDVVTTLEGYYMDPDVQPSLQPYPGVGTYAYKGPDAFLLRSLPDVDRETIVDVHLYARGPLDLVYAPVTAEDLLVGYRSLGWRGMAFSAPRAATVPLVLYRSTVSGDLVTTTRGAPSRHYESLGTVAHVPPAEPAE